MQPSGPQPAPSILIFCDLDRIRIDPPRHDVDSATRATLDRLARQGIPIVLSSHQTRAELEVIRQEFGVTHPFICESGSAVFVPHGYFGVAVSEARHVAGYEAVEFGWPYTAVVETLRRAADRLGIGVRGFSDMSVDEVATACALPLLQARLARLREYSEPFRVVDREPAATPRLLKALRVAGLQCTSRGPYHYAGTARPNIAAQFLSRLYRRAFGEIETVAFGGREGEVVFGLADSAARRAGLRW